MEEEEKCHHQFSALKGHGGGGDGAGNAAASENLFNGWSSLLTLAQHG